MSHISVAGVYNRCAGFIFVPCDFYDGASSAGNFGIVEYVQLQFIARIAAQFPEKVSNGAATYAPAYNGYSSLERVNWGLLSLKKSTDN
jgi:hypothetical protein